MFVVVVEVNVDVDETELPERNYEVFYLITKVYHQFLCTIFRKMAIKLRIVQLT